MSVEKALAIGRSISMGWEGLVGRSFWICWTTRAGRVSIAGSFSNVSKETIFKGSSFEPRSCHLNYVFNLRIVYFNIDYVDMK